MTNIMRNATQNATGHACIQDLFNIYFSKKSILLYFTLFLDEKKRFDVVNISFWKSKTFSELN